jgi:hypothetical protein
MAATALACAVCHSGPLAPQLVTRVLLQGKRRDLCSRCYDAWLDTELDLEKLDLDARPRGEAPQLSTLDTSVEQSLEDVAITAQATVEGHVVALFWLRSSKATLYGLWAGR